MRIGVQSSLSVISSSAGESERKRKRKKMAEAGVRIAAAGSPSSSSRLIGGRSRRQRGHPLSLPSCRRLLALKSSALRPSSSLSSEFFGIVRLVSRSAVPASPGRKGRVSVVAMAGEGETPAPVWSLFLPPAASRRLPPPPSVLWLEIFLKPELLIHAYHLSGPGSFPDCLLQ